MKQETHAQPLLLHVTTAVVIVLYYVYYSIYRLTILCSPSSNHHAIHASTYKKQIHNIMTYCCYRLARHPTTCSKSFNADLSKNFHTPDGKSNPT